MEGDQANSRDAPPPRLGPALPPVVGRLARVLESVPLPLVFVLALVTMFVVALLDVLTGPELSFAVFYLTPIALISWLAPRRIAVWMCVFGAVTWFAADRLAEVSYEHSSIPYWNGALRLGFFVVVALIVSAFRSSHRHEQALARTDPLTGVANTRAFMEAAEGDLYRARRFGRPLSLVYVDVDDFKAVNDRLGHSAGDRMLCHVARELRAAVRASDVVGRLGGDEFAILLPETGADAVGVVVAHLRERLANATAEAPARVTLSIGAVTFENLPSSTDELLRVADRLMYEAKARGKDEVARAVV